jgi:hypothetical protein
LARIDADKSESGEKIRVHPRLSASDALDQWAGGCAGGCAGLLKSTVGGAEMAFSFSTEKFALVL